MLAIFKREFKNYFMTPTTFIVFFLIFLFQIIALNGRGSFWFDSLKMALGISMIGFGTGLISKEFKNKTYKLLFCSPVSTTSIVLGKYFAFVVFFLITSSISTLICLVFRLCFGAIFTVPELIFGLLGSAFLIMFYAAVIIFVSTWGSNVGILCSVCYAGYFIIQLGDLYLSSHGSSSIWIRLYLVFFQFSKPYQKIMFGVINLETIIYFVSMTVGLLFLSKKFLESKRFV